MAFLRQTPDVQSAIGKIFSHGEIWLDASAILPMLAEDLLDDRVPQFQEIVRIATDAGLAFYVTSGVVRPFTFPRWFTSPEVAVLELR